MPLGEIIISIKQYACDMFIFNYRLRIFILLLNNYPYHEKDFYFFAIVHYWAQYVD